MWVAPSWGAGVAPIDPQELITSVARRIVELRRAKGMTQAQLAERMGCSVQYVGLVERGLQNLTLAKMAQIANVLGASIEDLMKRPRRAAMKIAKGRPRRA